MNNRMENISILMFNFSCVNFPFSIGMPLINTSFTIYVLIIYDFIKYISYSSPEYLSRRPSGMEVNLETHEYLCFQTNMLPTPKDFALFWCFGSLIYGPVSGPDVISSRKRPKKLSMSSGRKN